MTGFSETVDTGKIKMTMHVTMTLDEWKELGKQLDHDNWPASSFSSLVLDLINQAEKTFYPKNES